MLTFDKTISLGGALAILHRPTGLNLSAGKLSFPRVIAGYIFLVYEISVGWHAAAKTLKLAKNWKIQ